ncbi:MAG TPA: HNH endonuclease signature motif containing protein, partial [Mycobacteriales bacterium]|nr:HNH endonuclease signature motif containing protein [Mycobacteriales bacterium]
ATYRGLAQSPGDLDGYGPVTAATARDLASDGRPLRRILIDANGQVVDVGDRAYPPRRLDEMLAAPITAQALDDRPSRYQPSAALGRYVDVRDRTCTAPWCTRPACAGQHDHLTDHARGGPTTRDNLQAACDRDGTTAWISPTTGRAYPTEPHRYYTEPEAALAWCCASPCRN